MPRSKHRKSTNDARPARVLSRMPHAFHRIPPAHVTYTILDRYSHLGSLSREAAVQRGVKDFREDAVMIGRPKDRAISQTTRSVQY